MYNLKIMENNHPDEWLVDLPVQSENIAFKPEDLIICPKCERMNPPNRLKCFYCGGELEISEAQSKFIKPNLRKLELWEKGYNVIFSVVSPIFDVANLLEASRILKLETEVLQNIRKSKNPLPLVRVESEKEAQMIQKRLDDFGVETRIVSDEALAVEKPIRRLRGIEFFDDRLILVLFNQDATVKIAAEDLALIVTGAIYERKISATEKYNKKGDNQILDTTEISSDDSLIDIFSRDDSLGYRIYAKGFDFSSLEKEKELLAKDNIQKLVRKLRSFAPNARFIDDYAANRNLLADVWEVEQKTDSQGLKREGFGKFNLANVTTVSNLAQFTKYSRLQWHLL